ncbi:MAG: hypothetical protein M0Z96_03625 [Actinomycetota bacterium]|nr:hypothetical protein [Actinomycetota bacterium]
MNITVLTGDEHIATPGEIVVNGIADIRQVNLADNLPSRQELDADPSVTSVTLVIFSNKREDIYSHFALAPQKF